MIYTMMKSDRGGKRSWRDKHGGGRGGRGRRGRGGLRRWGKLLGVV